MSDELVMICGYAILFRDNCDGAVKEQLNEIGPSPSGLYGALFVLDPERDGRRKKWTVFTADYAYAQMLATETGNPLGLSTRVMREKFPAFVAGWVIDDEHEVAG